MSFRYLREFGLCPGQLAAFALYRDMLLEWNGRMNLTAITVPEEIEIKHFVDSLLLERCALWQASFARPGAGAAAAAGREPGTPQIKVADVGGGAGFPGFPLKLVRGGALHLDTLEASGKRVDFLRALARTLGLDETETEAVHIRAEEAGQNPAWRGRYDWALARGVAALPVLLEYCLPLLAVGGYLAAYKGPGGKKEAAESKKAAARLGSRLVDGIEAALPEGQGERHILIYRKVAPTPGKYPRRPGIPARQPVG